MGTYNKYSDRNTVTKEIVTEDNNSFSYFISGASCKQGQQGKPNPYENFKKSYE